MDLDQLKELEEREWLETHREWNFAFMRTARVSGQIIFYASLAVVLFGVMLFVLYFPDFLQRALWPSAWQVGAHMPEISPNRFGWGLNICIAVMTGALALGFAGVALGGAIIKPYQFTTEMPTTYIRICKHCKEPLPNKWIINSCPRCGTFLPLGFSAYMARLLSKCVTYLHWALLITAFCFLR